jgi:hypothetical protein
MLSEMTVFLLILVIALFTVPCEAASWDRLSGALYNNGRVFDPLAMDVSGNFLEWARRNGVSGSLLQWKDTLAGEESLTSGCTEYRMNEFTIYDAGTPERALEVFRAMIASGFSPRGLRWRRNTVFECWSASSVEAPAEITADYSRRLEGLVSFFDAEYIRRAKASSGLNSASLVIDQSGLVVSVPVSISPVNPQVPAGTVNAPQVSVNAGAFRVAEVLASQGYKGVDTPWGEQPAHYSGQGKALTFNCAPVPENGKAVLSWIMGVSRGAFTVNVNGRDGGMVMAAPKSFSKNWGHIELTFESMGIAGGAYWGLWKIYQNQGSRIQNSSGQLDTVSLEPARGCWLKLLPTGMPVPFASGQTADSEIIQGPYQLRTYSDSSVGVSLIGPVDFLQSVDTSGSSATLRLNPPASMNEPLASLKISVTTAPFSAASTPDQVATLYETAQLRGMISVTTVREKAFGVDVVRRLYRDPSKSSSGGERFTVMRYFWLKGRIYASRVDYSSELFASHSDIVMKCVTGLGVQN